MARHWTGSWNGGRTALGRRGKTVWVIEAARGCKRYVYALNVRSEAEAMAELALFERDPAAYRSPLPKKVRSDDVPCFSADLVLRFLEHKRDSISKSHLWDLAHYLKKWQAKLGTRDLRDVTLGQYRTALSSIEAPERKCILVLRSFTKWLRAQGLLAVSSDASRDLPIPQPVLRRKTGYSMGDFQKLYAALLGRPKLHGSQWGTVERKTAETPAQAVRDVLLLRALCGLHYSEIARLAAGEGEIKRVQGFGEIAGVLVFRHEKKGSEHAVSVPAKALAAAERLRSAGGVPDKKAIHRLMDEAAKVARVGKMRPGRLRHSFVTWARACGKVIWPKDEGVPTHIVAKVVGHAAGSRMTSAVYDGTPVPEMILLPLVLENPEDPIPLAESSRTAPHSYTVG